MQQELIKTDELNIDNMVLNNVGKEQFKEIYKDIREEVRDNPYILETLRVLPVGGYRSAIGSFWNAVVDDLRKKVIFRSVKLFCKEMDLKRDISCYEDFQNHVNDQMLIDGAHKIGVIGWEARKVLTQAKETRHIFDGHPSSSEPDLLKVLSMMSDCVKYVLSQDYPPQIIDINDYINNMGSNEFDKNEISISDAISDLPDSYKNELINRLFDSYINNDCSAILRSNIETVAPILWRVLSKETSIQVSHKVDKIIPQGNSVKTDYAFAFISLVGSKKYLTTKARMYRLKPYIEKLLENLDVFDVENKCVDELSKYAGFIPRELLPMYVNGLTQTYVGRMGGSYMYSRTDFYADRAALKIPKMFEKFDDESAYAFISAIKTNEILQERIQHNVKLNRLRNLGRIVCKRISENFEERDFLELLLNEEYEKDFFTILKSCKPSKD